MSCSRAMVTEALLSLEIPVEKAPRFRDPKFQVRPVIKNKNLPCNKKNIHSLNNCCLIQSIYSVRTWSFRTYLDKVLTTSKDIFTKQLRQIFCFSMVLKIILITKQATIKYTENSGRILIKPASPSVLKLSWMRRDLETLGMAQNSAFLHLGEKGKERKKR